MRLVQTSLVAALASCGGRPAAPKPVVAPATAAPTCGLPALVAAAEVREDDDYNRLVVYSTVDGQRVWTGPNGSGRVPAVWSPDGRLLAYAVGGDLIVRQAGKPDRLAVRGVATDAPPLTAFSPSGRYLVARVEGGTKVADLATGGALPPDTLPVEDCEADSFAWRPDVDELWVLCRSATPGLFVWDARTRKTRVVESDASAVLGWRTAAPAGMVVATGDAAAVIGAGDTLTPIESTGDAFGFVVDAAPAAGILVYSDKDADEGLERTLWLARGAGEPIWPWLQGLVLGMSITPDGAWAAFVVPEDGNDEAGDVYLARLGERRVRPVVEVERRGVMTGDFVEGPGAGDYDEDEHGDDDDDDDDDDEPPPGDAEDEPLLGYAYPVPQPQAARCTVDFPLGREQLAIAEQFGDGESALESNVVVLGSRAAGEEARWGGARWTLPKDWRMLQGLSADRLLIETDAGVELRGPGGDTLAEVAGTRMQDFVEVADGGLIRIDERELIMLDARGARRGAHTASDAVRDVWPLPGGGLLVLEVGEEAELLSPALAALARFPARDNQAAALTDGGVVALEEGEDPDSEETLLTLVFRDAAGKVRGRASMGVSSGDKLTLQPLAGGRLAVLDDESHRILFLDGRGRELGVFFTGHALEQPLAALEDGTLVVGFDRTLWLLGSDGSYRGGQVLPAAILTGPVALPGGRVAVGLDSGIQVLERKKR